VESHLSSRIWWTPRKQRDEQGYPEGESSTADANHYFQASPNSTSESRIAANRTLKIHWIA